MKLSMYNIETKTKDGLLIFNTVTSGILLLNEEYTLEYEKLKKEVNGMTTVNNPNATGATPRGCFIRTGCGKYKGSCTIHLA